MEIKIIEMDKNDIRCLMKNMMTYQHEFNGKEYQNRGRIVNSKAAEFGRIFRMWRLRQSDDDGVFIDECLSYLENNCGYTENHLDMVYNTAYMIEDPIIPRKLTF